MTIFNTYLTRKDYAKNPHYIPYHAHNAYKMYRMYLHDAISFFGKEKEYSLYKENQKLLNCVNEKNKLLEKRGMKVYHD